MASKHNDSWSPLTVWLNTAATVIGACTGIVAIVVAIIAILRS